jgi:hypothetical protein
VAKYSIQRIAIGMGLWIGIIRKTACYEVNRMEARRLEAKLGPKCKKTFD